MAQEKENPKLKEAGSVWEAIGDAQESLKEGKDVPEDINLLSNKKLDKKKKGKTKVTKNANNNKQRNRK